MLQGDEVKFVFPYHVEGTDVTLPAGATGEIVKVWPDGAVNVITAWPKWPYSRMHTVTNPNVFLRLANDTCTPAGIRVESVVLEPKDWDYVVCVLRYTAEAAMINNIPVITEEMHILVAKIHSQLP